MVEWSLAAFRAARVGAARSSSPCPPGHDHDLEWRRRRRGRRRRDPRRVGRERARGGRDRAGRDPRRGAAAGHARADRGRGRDPDRRPRGRRRRSPPRRSPTRSSRSRPRARDAAFGPGRLENAFDRRATLDRERLWAAQTPQVFRAEALREALAADPERRRGGHRRGDAGRGGRGQGPDPPGPAREPQGDDAARPASWPSCCCARSVRAAQTSVAAKQSWPTPRATPKLARRARGDAVPSAKAPSIRRADGAAIARPSAFAARWRRRRRSKSVAG